MCAYLSLPPFLSFSVGGDPWLTMSQTDQVSTVAKAIHIIADTSRVGANPMPTVTTTGTETAETTTTTSHHVHIGSAANYGKTISPTTTATTTTAATITPQPLLPLRMLLLA